MARHGTATATPRPRHDTTRHDTTRHDDLYEIHLKHTYGKIAKIAFSFVLWFRRILKYCADYGSYTEVLLTKFPEKYYAKRTEFCDISFEERVPTNWV